ncbi:hypothetical protein ACHAWF_016597 [Thalassiosira exigua]
MWRLAMAAADWMEEEDDELFAIGTGLTWRNQTLRMMVVARRHRTRLPS